MNHLCILPLLSFHQSKLSLSLNDVTWLNRGRTKMEDNDNATGRGIE